MLASVLPARSREFPAQAGSGPARSEPCETEPHSRPRVDERRKGSLSGGAEKMAGRSRASVLLVGGILLLWSGSSALAQGNPSSLNPAAAASDIRNPSSINPAAAASDIRNPTSINPAAAASDTRQFGATSPSPAPAVSPRRSLSTRLIQVERRPRHARRARAHRAAPLRAAQHRHRRTEGSHPASQPETRRKADRAATRIMGTVCQGC
jgi:hypothetical protein